MMRHRRRAARGKAALADLSTLYAMIVDPFGEFAFMRRALAGCLALSLGGAPVGVILMLRRMSLTGDAMAHAICLAQPSATSSPGSRCRR
jgi:hypothetical protein